MKRKNKICFKCEKPKPLDDFHRRSDSPDGRNGTCKQCKKEYHSGWYQKNKDRLKKLRKSRKKRIQEWYVEFKKSLRCKLCGDDRWYVLEFHHKSPSKKEECVSMLPYKGWGIKRILKEIKKCDVLCANCHKELHFLER